jgi:hypothetical protein
MIAFVPLHDDLSFVEELDRSGFGGHTARCKGVGEQSFERCKRSLLEAAAERQEGSQPACDALSYKDGQCYLHATAATGFYSDASVGHRLLRLTGLSLPSAIISQ